MIQSLPTHADNRIHSLDILRGIAVLGILLMNIQNYSMINAAYINPTSFGDFTNMNKIVWIIIHIIADQKFLSIFSILFGAGIILFSVKAGKVGKNAVKLHYKRMGYLLIFGLLHAYMLWHGDILVIYALCGLVVFLLRKKSSKTLMTLGTILVAIPFVLYLVTGLSLSGMPKESLENIMHAWSPDADSIKNEVAAFKGSWIEQMKFRIPNAIAFQTTLFLFLLGWKASGLMLIGMALFKMDMFSNRKHNNFYKLLTTAGIILGTVLTSVGIVKNFQHNWEMEYSMYFGFLFNYIGSMFTSLGYIGLIILLSNKKFMGFLFQKVGRMAFTNYLLQTLICTSIFYGHGLGLFGEVSRLEQLIYVLLIWMVIIAFSRTWLKYFQYGPFEWLWRVLTYGKIFKIKA